MGGIMKRVMVLMFGLSVSVCGMEIEPADRKPGPLLRHVGNQRELLVGEFKVQDVILSEVMPSNIPNNGQDFEPSDTHEFKEVKAEASIVNIVYARRGSEECFWVCTDSNRWQFFWYKIDWIDFDTSSSVYIFQASEDSFCLGGPDAPNGWGVVASFSKQPDNKWVRDIAGK